MIWINPAYIEFLAVLAKECISVKPDVMLKPELESIVPPCGGRTLETHVINMSNNPHTTWIGITQVSYFVPMTGITALS